MAKTLPIGKGIYIWAVRDCLAAPGFPKGNPQGIALRLKANDFTHAYVKVANGLNLPGVSYQTVAETRALIEALKAQGLKVYGWAYVLGQSPIAEADKHAEVTKSWGLDGFAADMEGEFDTVYPAWNASIGVAYVSMLRARLPDHAIGLASYRYPKEHPYFPWKQVLPYFDFHNPQVYWQGSHNPVLQLNRSYVELMALKPLPFAPIGSAYTVGGWVPAPSEMIGFLNAARSLNCISASFWELGRIDKYASQLWPPIAAYQWGLPTPPPPPPPTPTQEIITVSERSFTTVDIIIRDWKANPIEGSNTAGVLVDLPVVPVEAKVVKFRLVVAVTSPRGFVSLASGNTGDSRFRLTNMPNVVCPDIDDLNAWPRHYVNDEVLLPEPKKVYMQWDAAGGKIRASIQVQGWST